MARQLSEEAIKSGWVEVQISGLAFVWECIIKQAMRPCSPQIGPENNRVGGAATEFSLQAMLGTLDQYESAMCKKIGGWRRHAVGSVSLRLNRLFLGFGRP